jgi:hypothetical protein
MIFVEIPQGVWQSRQIRQVCLNLIKISYVIILYTTVLIIHNNSAELE